MIGERSAGVGERVEIGPVLAAAARRRPFMPSDAVQPAPIGGAVVVEGLGGEIDVERGLAAAVAASPAASAAGGLVARIAARRLALGDRAVVLASAPLSSSGFCSISSAMKLSISRFDSASS